MIFHLLTVSPNLPERKGHLKANVLISWHGPPPPLLYVHSLKPKLASNSWSSCLDLPNALFSPCSKCAVSFTIEFYHKDPEGNREQWLQTVLSGGSPRHSWPTTQGEVSHIRAFCLASYVSGKSIILCVEWLYFNFLMQIWICGKGEGGWVSKIWGFHLAFSGILSVSYPSPGPFLYPSLPSLFPHKPPSPLLSFSLHIRSVLSRPSLKLFLPHLYQLPFWFNTYSKVNTQI